ncbi:hypothetical protein NQ317_018543 [Molorchus minor]|uniref:aspartate transaminase n=1 Tax=Molorchus minor TaxID=1323400 RepID=A0ABQ9JVZ9_9CUCU|nr:hypothetical protein NQ317_018543 [Molorchus minor]
MLFEQKVNLGVGAAYRTSEGKPWVLPVVRAAEKALANDDTLNKEYLPVLGMEAFSNAATRMLLVRTAQLLFKAESGHVLAFGVQTLSGTGALRVGAEFLARILGKTVFYYSNPTWENHKLVFKNGQFLEAENTVIGRQDPRFRPRGVPRGSQKCPEGAVIILHACAHNPTGCDPTEDQWKQIAEVIREKKLFPFFDSAYQGFASGDLIRDASAVRYFVQEGFELFCAQSFAKNFGLYNERTGNLTVVSNNRAGCCSKVTDYSDHQRNVFKPSEPWRKDRPRMCDNIRTMSSRIIEMRTKLREALENLQTPGDWSHITKQIGMFSYTGLNEIQSLNMVKKHHVYMLRSGRISMCGLTPSNVDYVAKAIYETVTTLP